MKFFLTLSLILLPALLFWLAGWAYMDSSPGLHHMEWGYLAALFFFLVVFGSMLLGTFWVSRRSTGSTRLRWFELSYLLFFTAAFGIAVDSWGGDERPLSLISWVLPIIFMALFTIWRTQISGNQERTASLLVALSYFGLLCYIFVQMAGQVAWSESLTETRFDVYSLLGDSQRAQLRSLIDPMFFIGFAALWAAIVLVGLTVISTLKRRYISNALSKFPTFLIMFLLLGTYLINGVFPSEHAIWKGVSLFEFQLAAFSFLSFVVVAKTGISWLGLYSNSKPRRDVEDYLLVLVSSYALTPITFGVIGNAQFTVFWALLLSTLTTQSFFMLTKKGMLGSQFHRFSIPSTAIGIFLISIPFAARELLAGHLVPNLTVTSRAFLEWVGYMDNFITYAACFFVTVALVLSIDVVGRSKIAKS